MTRIKADVEISLIAVMIINWIGMIQRVVSHDHEGVIGSTESTVKINVRKEEVEEEVEEEEDGTVA